MQNSWNPVWDEVFASREWGKYPDLEVIRFVARNFYHHVPRSAVNLLEVGCGTGANVWYMAREGFHTSGVDGSSKAIDILQKRLNAEGLSADIHLGDITSLPFGEATFDAVVDCECIYCNNRTHTISILDEIHRVLKPGGRFLSLAFTQDTWGCGCGEPLAGEERTFLNMNDGPMKGTGLGRFASEEDIRALYGARFDIVSLETVRRSCEGRSKYIEEWIITCAKQAV